VLCYCDSISPRLQYVIHFLSNYFKHPFELTTDKQVFTAVAECKINYSATPVSKNEIWILPHGLLHQKNIATVDIKCTTHTNNYPVFFSNESDIHFDLFSALFYLISRYEEYLPHLKDMYGRYAFENSIAYKNNFLHLPLINIWLEDFRKILVQKNIPLEDTEPEFQFIPTYDIDIAWSYKNKGFVRTAGGMVKSILMGDDSSITSIIDEL
jgi:hypothetical protein